MAANAKEHQDATAADFANLFESTKHGQLVLETLIRRFSRPPVYEGGIDGIRKSDRRAGERAVVDHIIRQINRSRGVMAEEPAEE